MQRSTISVWPSLAVVVLLAGCSQGDSNELVAVQGKAAGARPIMVDQPLPAWHPVLPEGHPPLPGIGLTLPEGHPPLLPEGHPPITGEECPANDMSGFGEIPAAAPSAPETIST